MLKSKYSALRTMLVLQMNTEETIDPIKKRAHKMFQNYPSLHPIQALSPSLYLVTLINVGTVSKCSLDEKYICSWHTKVISNKQG